MSEPIIFTDAAQRILAGKIVRMAIAVRLDLRNETLFLWRGHGSVTTNDGSTWQGLGKFGDISGLDFGPQAAIDPITLSLSGLDADLAQAARAQQSEMRGRTVSVYVLLFDENFAPLDAPYLCQMAIIDRGSLKYDGGSFVLELTAEPLFASKHVPALNLVADADQQARFPGDKIFERISFSHTIFWAT